MITIIGNSATYRAHRRMRGWLAAILTGAALLFGPCAQAVTRCVATVNGGKDGNDYGLLNAFSEANNGAEGTTWDIRLRYGTYQLADSLEFEPAGNKDNKAFYLSGGWNADCSSRTGDASNTIVRGVAPTQNAYGTDFRFIGNNARYDIEYIRFEYFS